VEKWRLQAPPRYAALPIRAVTNFRRQPYDATSRAKYDALRAKGHGHARSLRSVADRLLKVACTMLNSGTLFDPEFAGKRAIG
jgi:hypothetical protein